MCDEEGVTDPSEEQEEVGIPKECRLKRRYTVTDKVRKQRADAAASKAHADALLGNKNAWKHGNSAQNFIESKIRPCLSTCSKYPCSIIVEGATKPGGDCLDKAEIIGYYRAILKGIQQKDYGDFNEVAALLMAQTIHTAQMLLEDVARDGSTLKRDKVNKIGEVIATEYVPHPSLQTLPKILAELKINPNEFMLTPKIQAKLDEEEKDRQTLTSLMEKATKALSNKEQKE